MTARPIWVAIFRPGEWFTRAGVNQPPSDRGLKINSTAAVIRAAVAGQGGALVRKALVARELESGRPMHLLSERPWPVKWAYYVAASPKTLRGSKVGGVVQADEYGTHPGS